LTLSENDGCFKAYIPIKKNSFLFFEQDVMDINARCGLFPFQQ